MDLDTRIANLVAATAHGTLIEQEMLREGILVVGKALTETPGSTAPPLVILETGRSCFHKRFNGQNATNSAHYGHHAYDVPLNEVAAWRLAYAMGQQWRRMVPTCVLRKIEEQGGALMNDKKARADMAVFNGDATKQVNAAGFWDALIGNQDRNTGNFRYDSVSKTLGLIDHGYVFARPGDFFNTSMFFAYRRTHHQIGLLAPEKEVLEALLESGNLFGLRSFLASDRADALQVRAENMLHSGCLPVAGAF
jgi:hypothetical protein